MKRYLLFLALCCFPVISWSANNDLEIQITGLPKTEAKIIESTLTLKNLETARSPKNQIEEERIFSLYQLGKQEISNSLESLGYYRHTIQAELVTTPKGYIAKYHIHPGAPLLLEKVQINMVGAGSQNKDLRLLIKNAPLESGQPLNHSLYETYKKALLGRALQLGYLDAVFTEHEIRIDLKKNRADILLKFDTGNPYYFGEVQFAKPPYPEQYLKKYIPFSAGSPYNTEQLLNFQKTLTDTDLFNKIRIDPQLNDTHNYTVPLKVRLTRKPYNKYIASGGFGTDTGVRGFLGWERRRATYPGHRVQLNGRGSRRINQANAQYTIPGKHPATDRFAIGTQITEEKPADKKYSLRSETGVTHLQKRGRLEQIFGLHYLSEIYRELPTDPKQHSHFLMPKIGYAWTSIKKTTLLQHGTRVSIGVRGGLQSAFSTTNLIQGEARLKWITPLGEYTRFIVRSDIGATAAKNPDKIPLSLRFFTGGDHTVRGYGYQSIGPRQLDSNGNEIVVGGRYLFVGSVELERKIYKNIGVAVFTDTGNAMNRWSSRLKTGSGVGVLYETPLGPLRLDVARAMQKGKHKPRVHLTFGMDL